MLDDIARDKLPCALMAPPASALLAVNVQPVSECTVDEPDMAMAPPEPDGALDDDTVTDCDVTTLSRMYTAPPSIPALQL